MTLLKKTMPTFFSDFFDTDSWFDRNSIWPEWKLDKIPNANVVEKDDGYEIEMAVPGMKKEDFNITCENRFLTVKAEKEEKEEKEEKNYTRREYNYASFSRSFTLPENVNFEGLTAKYDNGTLSLSIPKLEEAKILDKKEVKVQ